MRPLISIVIPVYNVQDYISLCLSSIVNQTYKAWECILVDDGSSDRSGAICDEFAQKDSRFKVIHKLNEGVSIARNYGTRSSCGKWITYVDSDDTISKSFLSAFSNRLKNESFDLFMGDVEQIGIDNTTFIEYNLSTCIANLSDSINIHRILRSGDLHGKLFRRDIIEKRNLSFDRNIKYSEDGLFFDKYLVECNSIAFDRTICYRYKRNENGLSYKLNSFESEYYCMKELITALSNISNATDIPICKLLHDSPALRTIKSAVKDLTLKEFTDSFNSFSSVETYFIDRVLDRFSRHKIFVNLFRHKKMKMLYYILQLHMFLKGR